MRDLKTVVMQEFRNLSDECGATWTVTETFCELYKNGVTLRVRWTVERIEGVFVTLAIGAAEYGLPYLVEFRGGDASESAAASSDDPIATAEVARKYALPLLEFASDFSAFAAFVEKRVSEYAIRRLDPPRHFGFSSRESS